MNSLSLKYIIVYAIKKWLNIGLNIIATICDQFATNGKTINMLLKDTEELYRLVNLVLNKFALEITNHEIVPLNDPPHLLKCMRMQ